MSGETYRLLPSGGPDRVTLMMFWTRWCLASQKYIRFLSRLASEHVRAGKGTFAFVGVAVERANNSMIHRELVRCVVENGWNQESMRHFFVFEKDKANSKDHCGARILLNTPF